MKRFILVILLIQTLTYAQEITLAFADIESYPLQMGNGTELSNPPGLAVDLILAAAKEINIKVNIIRLPNKRIFRGMELGNIDGAFCFSYKDERLNYGNYPRDDGIIDSSRRVTSISYFLYRLKESSIYWNGKEFINLSGILGGNSGYSIVNDLRSKGIKIEEAKTTEQNLLKLLKKRIVGYAGQDITTDEYIRSETFKDIEKVPIPLATKDYFLMLSNQFINKNPELAESLWTKIGELRDEIILERSKYYIIED